MASPRPTHEEFTAGYTHHVPNTPVRNVQVTYTTHESTYEPTQPAKISRGTNAIKTGIKLARKTKVSTTNASIFAWALPLWFTVQLPFALLSLAMLGLAGVVDAAIQSFAEDTGVVGSIFSVTAGVLSWLGSAAGAAFSYLTGIDISVLNMAQSLFIICYLVSFVVGIITLLTISLQYLLTLHKPFSGENAGLKIGMFMLAIVGYFFPIANLFPWALVFMAAVWKYPQ